MNPKLKLYNQLSRKAENFVPFDIANVKIYTCGPTVYSTPHIGNFAAYVYWDLLVRTLQANGYGVKRVLNLTDVGHLVSDGDDGEDKLEKGARQTGRSVWEVAEKYIAEFQRDFEALNLTQPAVWARATDYIPADEELVDVLTDKGYTYETADGIYYDTSKFATYADFASLKLDSLKAGARVEFSDEKRNISDFSLWKFIQPGEKHEMRWDYLGRPGYPGWHLECSTIIHTELGETIDIHTGGIDHIPVHHTNEIAQSEAAFDKKLSKYWLHCNHLTSEGQKISKSLGNGYSLADLTEKGFSPLDYKMWVLQGHYQSERDFSLSELEAAKTRRLKWRNRIAKCYQTTYSIETDAENYQKILNAVDDNLNSPLAFAIIDVLGDFSLDLWQAIDQLFGLGLVADTPDISEDAKELLRRRAIAREERDFAQSDLLRDELAKQNITVLDSPEGQIWQYLS